MKFLIPQDEYGMLASQQGIALVDSLFVAEAFEKRHSHVLAILPESLNPNLGSVKNSLTLILNQVPIGMLRAGNCRVT